MNVAMYKSFIDIRTRKIGLRLTGKFKGLVTSELYMTKIFFPNEFNIFVEKLVLNIDLKLIHMQNR